MRPTILLAFILLFASGGLLAQSSVAGTWTDSTLRLVLQTAGDVVTGTVKDGQADSKVISNGVMEGTRLRFTTDAKLNGKDVTIQWAGELAGDELTVTRTIPSAPSEKPYPPFNGPFVLHRSK
jgi:hypothetical protein